MDPNKNLTNKQTAIIIGSIFGFLALSAIFASCSPKQQAVAPTPAVDSLPSPVAIASPSPTPKIIKGRFIRTGEDFRYESPADITLADDGTIHVATSRQWQTTMGTSKANYRFAFKPDGRWTEQESTYESTDGKTYPFTYEGGYSLTRNAGTAQISANLDDAPRPAGTPWITVEFSTPEQSTTIAPKTEALPRDASPAEVEAVNQITPDRNAPSGQAAALDGPDPDARIEVYDAAIKPLHYGFPGDRVTILGNGSSPNGDLWHQIRFDQSGAEGWVSRRNIDFVGTTPEAPAEPQQQTSSAPSQTSSGRCNSPDDTDSRGRRCGARARKR